MTRGKWGFFVEYIICLLYSLHLIYELHVGVYCFGRLDHPFGVDFFTKSMHFEHNLHQKIQFSGQVLQCHQSQMGLIISPDDNKLVSNHLFFAALIIL